MTKGVITCGLPREVGLSRQPLRLRAITCILTRQTRRGKDRQEADVTVGAGTSHGAAKPNMELPAASMEEAGTGPSWDPWRARGPAGTLTLGF